MALLWRILAIALGLVLAVVAGVFGLVVIGVVVVLALIFALFGKAKFKVNVNRGPRPGTNRAPPPSPFASGDVIDIEAKNVEPPPRKLT